MLTQGKELSSGCVSYSGCHTSVEIPSAFTLNVKHLAPLTDNISEFAALEGKGSSYYELSPVLSFLPDLIHLILIETQ